MYHTGIVEKVSGGRVYTIEGNTSSQPGVVPNGGCVRDKNYPHHMVHGSSSHRGWIDVCLCRNVWIRQV